MPAQRLSKDKRAMVLSIICEGTPINATCRILGVAKESVLRVIAETGEALADYMSKNFRDLPCQRVAFDEQWQYVGKHGQRMRKRELTRGDFWLWTALDSDTKLVFSHVLGRRDRFTCSDLVKDAASRITDPVQ